MASFNSHITQSLKNLSFLETTNQHANSNWDWQVTAAYYVAVHIINAHLAQGADKHYTTHEKVKTALFADVSPVKIDRDIFLSYQKLENLSRRSRYLCTDTENAPASATEHLTYEIHLKKALVKLDEIMIYFAKKYNISFPKLDIDCIDLKNTSLTYFRYVALKTS